MKRYYTTGDHYLYMEGTHQALHAKMGAHVVKDNNVILGTQFAVYAPNAKRVSVVGDFNGWNGNHHVMKQENGIWNLYIQGLMPQTYYKYEIITAEGDVLLKADPFAFLAQQRPETASVVYDLQPIAWEDAQWIEKKASTVSEQKPMNIYEVHLGSWKRTSEQIEDSSFYTWKELTQPLIQYVKDHSYTHIELMPVYEHPFDLSWGYMATGYYAPSSRYGTPEDFMMFVNECHKAGIGVIMDWVPGHFCKDSHGLRMFDGSAVYEYPYEDVRDNLGWGTSNFNLDYGPVQSFLISNAMYWMEHYHIDGFRVDAVANIIYWLGEEARGVNHQAVKFLQRLNTIIKEKDPSFMMIAEDSTSYPNVTRPAKEGGLGFDFKWNMGWMNDTLDYMEVENVRRSLYHQKITFSMAYAYSEQFVLPFSHDEVVHGKKSIVDKSPGDYWQKLAQYRLLMTYQMTLPGKKLNFMGNEIAQFHEWKDKEEVDWHLLTFPAHDSANRYVKDLNALYVNEKALWALDQTYEGFEWIDVNNTDQSIFSYIRKTHQAEDTLIVILNFKPIAYHQYKVGVPYYGEYRELLNSDRDIYNGSNQYNGVTLTSTEAFTHGKPYTIDVTIPPYGAVILKVDKLLAKPEVAIKKTSKITKTSVRSERKVSRLTKKTVAAKKTSASVEGSQKRTKSTSTSSDQQSRLMRSTKNKSSKIK